jgi:quercetin dioxygenase-like cupin family protein
MSIKSNDERRLAMEKKVFADIEKFSPDKHVLVPIFDGERAKVVLLCLAPGTAAPPHSHPGFEVSLQPLRGRAIFQVEGGEEVILEPGAIYFAQGEGTFNPRNPHAEPFQMLIHLVKK